MNDNQQLKSILVDSLPTIPPQESPASEGYPEGWMHCKIHLNPETGEMHSDGDHRVRHWIQERILNNKK